ncbi:MULTISPECIES: VOC family protein [Saccharibacillus]|uniref:VOC family protein n=1 Tax=Saccharibacillus TaxID=456492 RepID=UPI00123BB8B0|nr:VOC family protein [Saccharibacillus sp. WB 17]MWJ30179.1 VOC family protein [Saccharibacillus sp. WB 17]
MIQGLFETHINVSNYEVSAEFYERVLDLIPLHEDPARKSKFYWIGRPGEAMFGIREHDPSPLVQRQHFAFRVALKDLETARARLEERGVETTNFFGEKEAPLSVFSFMPAVSVYFSDPDGHSVELLAMLGDEPKPELGILPWPEWEYTCGRAGR